MKAIKLLIAVVLVSSCASYQSGNYAEVAGGKHPKNFAITANIDYELSTEHYTFINMTFGNHTDEWVRVKSFRFDLKDDALNKKTQVVAGSDIASWTQSIQHKQRIDRYNTEVLLGSLALAGAAAAVGGARGGSEGLTKVGAGTYVLSAGVMVANATINQISDLERASLFPANHVYRSFSVPAGLFANKFLLLKIRQKEMPSVIKFTIEYEDGSKADYQTQVRSGRRRA